MSGEVKSSFFFLSSTCECRIMLANLLVYKIYKEKTKKIKIIQDIRVKKDNMENID